MRDQSYSFKTIDTFVLLSALILLVLGTFIFLRFDELLRFFIHLSPDRSFFLQTLLILKTSFLSLALVGTGLLFFYLLRKRGLQNTLRKLENIKELNFVLLFLGLAFVLRLLWIVFIPTQLYADWKWYDDAAYQMSQTWTYLENGLPTAYWPIGYPFFLAVIYRILGHSYFAVEFINILLSLAICLFSYLIAKRLVGSISSRITLGMLALFPSQIFFTNVLAAEIVFTFLLLVFVYLLLRQELHSTWYSPLIVGILLGLLTLIRAVTLLLPVLVILFYLKSGRRFGLIVRNTILTLLLMFLTLFPWMMRNKREIGSFTVATSGGINLYIGNNPHSSGSWVWQKENPFQDLTAPHEVENDKLGYQLASRYILNDPTGFIIRGIKKEIYLFVADFSALSKELDLAAQSNRIDKFVIFNLVGQTYYLLVLIFSIGGIFMFLRGDWGEKAGFYLLIGILLYWAGIHFIFFGIDRFHFPLVPFLSIFASGFIGSYLVRQDKTEQISTQKQSYKNT
jgi:4-amino-4-deoxy-L-arabinose transferase-like glycosyltransferase